MSVGNQTSATDFFIVGFPGLQQNYYGLVGTVFFLVYFFTLVGNAAFLVLFTTDRNLHKPMYVLTLNLAVSDVLFSTTTLPKIIAKYWFQAGTISFTGCFVQMACVHYFATVSSFILLIMALDRYIAICYPLRYPKIITSDIILILSITSWVLSIASPIIAVIRAYPQSYCTSHTIIQCFCDLISVTALASCDNNWKIQVIAFAGAMTVLLGPLTFILFSYISIIIAVMKVANLEGRYKAFSTCSPQLCIICLYYVPRCFNYVVSIFGFNLSADIRIVMILLYSLFPPVVNPLVYCFKTTEIKETLSKRFKSIKTGVAGCNS
uniref:Olfactory receptor n=1 Tax=Scleropages formosus TaxID=113540 RepID=A0A8C9VE25_SCLFO